MVRLCDLSYATSEKQILRDLNYVFEEKAYVLQGESGIGKTTLLNIICGYVIPDSGEVRIREDKRIAYLFQEVLLFHNITVRENIYMKCNALHKDAGEAEKLADEVCKRFRIESKLDSKVRELSGGERQRVQLAMLCLEEFDILLLDEPIANLDHENSVEIMNDILSFKDVMILIVSHQRIEASDQYTLLEMKDGGLHEV